MVSVLGDYYYEFPKPKQLEHKLKELLENEVDEKYYLSASMKEYIKASNGKWTGNDAKSIINRDIAVTINTRVGNTRADCSDYICDELPQNYNLKTSNKRLLEMLDKIDLSQTQAIDIYNQSIHQEMHTIKTNIDTSNMTAVTQDYRIRKLTPKECFRLMGVKDQDFENIAQNQSNASLYHLARDSIVVDVLMAIFKNMLE